MNGKLFMKAVSIFLASLLTLGGFNASLFASEPDYQAKVLGRLDKDVKYGGARDTYKVAFQIKTATGKKIMNGQSLALAFDRNLFDVVNMAATAELPEPIYSDTSWSVNIGSFGTAYSEWTSKMMVRKTSDGNIGFVVMDPYREPEFMAFDGLELPDFASIQTVRLAFKPGKTHLDMTEESIRLMSIGELNLTNNGYQALVYDGLTGYYYGARTGIPDTLDKPVLDFELPGHPIIAEPITGVVSPVVGLAPSNAIDNGTNFTSAVAWADNPSVFAYNTVYTAIITLTAKDGFAFTGLDNDSAIAEFTVNGIKPVFVRNTGSELVFNAIFPVTPKENRTVTVSAPVFPAETYGYTVRPDARVITITNIGNSEVTINSVALSTTDPAALDHEAFSIAGFGTVVPAGESINTWTVQPVLGLNAGNRTALIEVFYNGTDSTTASQYVTMIVNKAAPPSITWPEASAIYYTQSLADSILTGGSDQYGSFAWKDSAIAPPAGIGSYPVVFTPNDDARLNYEPIIELEKNVSVNVTNSELVGTVTITGDAVYGQTLKAVTADLASIPAVALGNLTYQWNRNGVPISGAESDTYVLIQEDIGQTITVTVMAANCGGSVSSAPTSAITKASQTAPPAPTLKSKDTTSITLNTISGAEYSKDGTNWQDATLFDNLLPDVQYTFFARIKETAAHFASEPSAELRAATDKASLIGTISINGIAVFGQTLTADTTKLSTSPAVDPGKFSYQWKRGETLIDGANGLTYLLTQSDIGQVITVTVFAANCENSVASNPTAAVSKAAQEAPDVTYTLNGDWETTGGIITITSPVSGAVYSLDDVSYSTANPIQVAVGVEKVTLYVKMSSTDTHNESSPKSVQIVFETKKKGYVFTDGNGNSLEHLSETVLITTLTRTNSTDKAENLTMHVAIYAPDGRLAYSGKYNKIFSVGQTSEMRVELRMPENADGGFVSKGYYAHVFLWNGATFEPVTEKFTFM